MPLQPVAVAPDVHDVAVVGQAVDEGGGHDFIAKDLASFHIGVEQPGLDPLVHRDPVHAQLPRGSRDGLALLQEMAK